MSLISRRTGHVFNRGSRAGLLLSLAAVLLLAAGRGAHAQQPGTQVHDASALHPPAGARVAIVEFADLECPACARANPVVEAAAARYGIPWVRHNILIPYHVWSENAAIDACWFDTQSKTLGNEYRNQVFANQPFIYNREMLREFTAQFAVQHHVAMPTSIDPQGKLSAMVQADNDLGKRIGINHTPTIFIVMAGSKGAPYIEVEEPEQDLDRTIAEAIAETTPARKPIRK
jgi:protein-disulfide isomerase